MKKVSIIIPVYNGEKYLAECIESVLNQTYGNIELILIDDGSTDNSGKICDEYSQKDSRVIALHQPNSGVSIARNKALVVATGDYIGFIDADDIIKNNYYEIMTKSLEKSGLDIVMCDSAHFSDDAEKSVYDDTVNNLESGNILKENITSDLLTELAGVVWKCVYKKELIKNNNIYFPENLPLSEDRIFNLYAMGYSNGICYVKEPLYLRRHHGENAVLKYRRNHFEILKDIYALSEKAIHDVWNEKEFEKAVHCQFVANTVILIGRLRNKKCKEKYSVKKRIIKKICNDNDLIESIKKSGINGETERYILNKNYFMILNNNKKIVSLFLRIKKHFKNEGIKND